MNTCIPCGNQGVVRTATRVVNGKFMCDEHAKEKLLGVTAKPKLDEPIVTTKVGTGTTVAAAPKEAKVTKRDVDWDKLVAKVQKGESVSEVAREAGVTAAALYYHTKGKVQRSARVGSVTRTPKAKAVASAATGAPNGKVELVRERYAPLIADLKLKRDKLTSIIESLETI